MDGREKGESGPEIIFEKIIAENFEKNNERNQVTNLRRSRNHKQYNIKKFNLSTAKKTNENKIIYS